MTRPLALLLIVAGGWANARALPLENGRYRLEVAADGAVAVTVPGMPAQRIEPIFAVIYRADDPGIYRNFNHHNLPIAPRSAVRWLNVREPAEEINLWLASPEMRKAMGLDGRVIDDPDGARHWDYRDASGQLKLSVGGIYARGTSRPYRSGQVIWLRARTVTVEDRTIRWEFSPSLRCSLRARLLLPVGDGDPEITFELTPAQAGFYSVAFAGAPSAPFASALSVPQECAGAAQRQFDFVLSEADLKLPRVQAGVSGGQIAVVADPAECRFRLPTLESSRFGLMLAQAEGGLRPELLAPLLGGAESRMSAGTPWRFTFEYVQRPGGWESTYRHIASDIQGFRDQRDASGPGSLNECLEHLMDFLGDRDGHNYALWHDEQKYYDYFTDQTGVFKPFSPMPGLSAAVVTDDEDFYLRRARPAVEFALSRRWNVFSPYEGGNVAQVKYARAVGGPYIGYAQLVGLSEFFQNRVPALAALARAKGPAPGNIADALARWELTGDRTALSDAERDGARTLSRGLSSLEPSLFGEQALFDFSDLYAASGDSAFLRGAVEAAYRYTTSLNLYPVPPSRTVTVDQGGVAPIHFHSFGRHALWGFGPPQPVPTPQQTVPAWRISRLGLRSPAYPIEYWQNAHASILRAGAAAHDAFLRDIARAGMIGRFGNYPGDNRSKDSLIGERPDAVEARPWNWDFATVNPGHAWDFAGAVLDFLVTDAFAHSGGAIDFPAESLAGSNFRTRAYGARPGRFYGDAGVRLWLPRRLLACDNRQFDWLAGYASNTFYLALWNQSGEGQRASVVLSRDWVDCRDGSIRTWLRNHAMPNARIEKNTLSIDVPAKGIIAFAIPAAVKPRLQAKLFDASMPALPAESWSDLTAPFGAIHALVLTAGRGLSSAFVYTEAPPEQVIAARLRWRQGAGDWHEMEDAIYPYEFSPALTDGAGDFEGILVIENAQRQTTRSPVIRLRLTAGGPVCPPDQAATPAPAARAQPVNSGDDPSFTPSPDFIHYLEQAANSQALGRHSDGRFYPYSTPLGRRIGWRQPVWDDALYAEGCDPAEAELHLRAEINVAAGAIRSRLAVAQPAVDFDALSPQQREILVDLSLTEGAANLGSDLLACVLHADWAGLRSAHLYVRYGGPAPDHSRNRAFYARWLAAVPLKAGDPVDLGALLQRMTLREKVGQLSVCRVTEPDIEARVRAGEIGGLANVRDAALRERLEAIALHESRLHIPLLHGADVIHGYRTIFPIPLGQSAAWDPELTAKAASIAAEEASAAGIRWTFAPMVDVARDPRWGRIAEGCGEDPFLAGALGAAMVRGFQGAGLDAPGSIAACPKHFAGYGASEGGRDYNTVDVSEGTLRDVYLAPFHACVEAGAATVMSSFSDVDGVPATANPFLLRQVLRDEWRFPGFVVSDAKAVEQLVTHGLCADEADAARQAMLAGLDVDLIGSAYHDHLERLVASGAVPVGRLDEAVRSVLELKRRLGLFKPLAQPMESSGAEPSSAHLAVARRLAAESIVLLKNEDQTLPLRPTLRTIAVIGPLADAAKDQLGCWAVYGRPQDSRTPLQAIRERAGPGITVRFAAGMASPVSRDRQGFGAAVNAVRGADVAVLFLGEPAAMSGEAHNRAYLSLPGAQEELVRAVEATGTPVVIVLMGGRPLEVGSILDRAPALLMAWHPGTMGGPAIADALFGDVNPSGHLTVSWPRTVGQVPLYYDHLNTGRPAPDPQRIAANGTAQVDTSHVTGYVDAPSSPQFVFGFGLSYTTFRYDDLRIDPGTMAASGSVRVSARVTNTGARRGGDVAQLYVRDLVASSPRPVRELKGFQRIALKPGERKTVEFTLTADSLAFHDRSMHRVIEPGRFLAWVGDNSAAELSSAFTVR